MLNVKTLITGTDPVLCALFYI